MQAQAIEPVTQSRPPVNLERGDPSPGNPRVFWGYRSGKEIWLPPEEFERRTRKLERETQDRIRERIEKAYTARRRPPPRPSNGIACYRQATLEKSHKQRFPKRIRMLIDLAFERRGFSRRINFETLLGVNMPGLLTHLEGRFSPGMSWADREKWTLGYIVPLRLAQTSAEMRALHHHTNLRPVWLKDRDCTAYPLSLPADIDPAVHAIWQRAQEI